MGRYESHNGKIPPLVEASVADIDLYADWVELAAVCLPECGVARLEIQDALNDAGVLQDATFSGSNEFEDDDTDLSLSDSISIAAETVWMKLRDRTNELGQTYPFVLTEDGLKYNDKSSSAVEYVSMLLVDMASYYPEAKLKKYDPFRLMFERVVENAMAGLFGPDVFVMGTSRDLETADLMQEMDQDECDESPNTKIVPSLKIVEAIKDMCHFYGLTYRSVEHEIDGDDKDLTLDLVSRMGHLGGGPGGQYFLVQCCTSPNWLKTKRGEPSLFMWRDLVSWDGITVAAIAVPYRETTKSLRRGFKMGGGVVVFDRTRLSRGLGKVSMPEPLRNKLHDWSVSQLEKFPRSF